MTDAHVPRRAHDGPPPSSGPGRGEPRVLGGRYEIGSVLGRGGMAVVSRARDLRLGRDVAVKELRLDLASDPTFQARFRREAQAAAGLNHPNIVSVYDTGEELDPHGRVPIPFIVMELVHGRTLRDILREGRPILPRRALEFTQGVLDALGYSHKAGIVHRDIKPANVMLTPAGTIKVMDFGIARAVSDTSATMTQTAAVIGTAQYLSPEQARGETVDYRSDLYSTGCLLYELLVGRPPFQGDSPVSVAYQHVREQPVPPSQLDPEITAPMDAVTLRALAKNPDDRYQSAAEMHDDIARILGGQRVHATLPPPVPPLVASAAGTAVLGAGEVLSPTTGTTGPVTGTLPGTGSVPAVDTRRGHGALWWVLGSIVALFAVLLGVYLVWLQPDPGPRMVTVPAGLIGSSQTVASARVTEAELVPRVETVQGSVDTINQVVDVDPVSGSPVEVNSTVILTVNIGPERRAIPDGLEGLTFDEARSILNDAGFPDVRSEDASEADEPVDAEAGEVVSVSPASGTQAATSDTVTLTVATGRARLPYLIGLTVAEAQAEAGEYGFINFETEEQVSAETPGEVIATRPLPSQLIDKSETITLIVAREAPTPTPTPEPVETPEPDPDPEQPEEPSPGPTTTP